MRAGRRDHGRARVGGHVRSGVRHRRRIDDAAGLADAGRRVGVGRRRLDLDRRHVALARLRAHDVQRGYRSHRVDEELARQWSRVGVAGRRERADAEAVSALRELLLVRRRARRERRVVERALERRARGRLRDEDERRTRIGDLALGRDDPERVDRVVVDDRQHRRRLRAERRVATGVRQRQVDGLVRLLGAVVRDRDLQRLLRLAVGEGDRAGGGRVVRTRRRAVRQGEVDDGGTGTRARAADRDGRVPGRLAHAVVGRGEADRRADVEPARERLRRAADGGGLAPGDHRAAGDRCDRGDAGVTRVATVERRGNARPARPVPVRHRELARSVVVDHGHVEPPGRDGERRPDPRREGVVTRRQRRPDRRPAGAVPASDVRRVAPVGALHLDPGDRRRPAHVDQRRRPCLVLRGRRDVAADRRPRAAGPAAHADDLAAALDRQVREIRNARDVGDRGDHVRPEPVEIEAAADQVPLRAAPAPHPDVERAAVVGDIGDVRRAADRRDGGGAAGHLREDGADDHPRRPVPALDADLVVPAGLLAGHDPGLAAHRRDRRRGRVLARVVVERTADRLERAAVQPGDAHLHPVRAGIELGPRHPGDAADVRDLRRADVAVGVHVQGAAEAGPGSVGRTGTREDGDQRDEHGDRCAHSPDRPPEGRRRLPTRGVGSLTPGGSGCASPAATAGPPQAPTRTTRRRRRSAHPTRAGRGRCRA